VALEHLPLGLSFTAFSKATIASSYLSNSERQLPLFIEASGNLLSALKFTAFSKATIASS